MAMENSQAAEIGKLKKEIEALNNMQKQLFTEQDRIRERINQLHRRMKNVEERVFSHDDGYVTTGILSTTVDSAKSHSESRHASHKISAPTSNPDAGIVDAYNTLSSLAGLDRKKAREHFAQQYRIRSFACINYAQRMCQPTLPPIFFDDIAGHFWAIQQQGAQYAVFPDVRNYEEQQHYVGGMKEAFRSNYKGGVCSRIKVIKPAIFTSNAGSWTLDRPGELQLS